MHLELIKEGTERERDEKINNNVHRSVLCREEAKIYPYQSSLKLTNDREVIFLQTIKK